MGLFSSKSVAQPIAEEEKAKRMRDMYAAYKFDEQGVQDVTPATVSAWQAESGHELIVVDVRTEAEQQISMIPGAITETAFARRGGAKLLQKLAAKRPVRCVAYCTIGKRSGDFCVALSKILASDLDTAHSLKIFNLAGSILAWTHAGLDLVAPKGNHLEEACSDVNESASEKEQAKGPRTMAVHAFGAKWAAVVPQKHDVHIFQRPIMSFLVDKMKRKN